MADSFAGNSGLPRSLRGDPLGDDERARWGPYPSRGNCAAISGPFELASSVLGAPIDEGNVACAVSCEPEDAIAAATSDATTQVPSKASRTSNKCDATSVHRAILVHPDRPCDARRRRIPSCPPARIPKETGGLALRGTSCPPARIPEETGELTLRAADPTTNPTASGRKGGARCRAKRHKCLCQWSPPQGAVCLRR